MKMYQDRFAVALKHNGKILRETKDLVQLPFGSEFTVLVKNLNSRRAKFTLQIDGTDVLDGESIIVNANSEVEMKRFIRNGNMDEGNAFKFIERTAAIEEGPRGIKIDDGVVRVEFWFEQEKPQTVVRTIYQDRYYRDWCGSGYPYPYGPYYGTFINSSEAKDNNTSLRGMVKSATASGAASTTLSNAVASATSFSTDNIGSISDIMADAIANDVGITVPGSKVDQKFTPVYGFTSETESHVIILRIAGKMGDVEVAVPVTVKSKPKCVTCGKLNKATSKFCSGCGTSLTIV